MCHLATVCTETEVFGQTWPVKGVAGPVVVVSLIKGQADVCGTFGGLLEHQARHIAPQLEGGAHCQTHGARGQMGRPVHHLVGQLTLVPPLSWGAQTSQGEVWKLLFFKFFTNSCGM